jgi:hypothetical protein
MVPLDRDDPGWGPEHRQLKEQPRKFVVSVFIDRDYYVQTISDDVQTVLAYSVTTRSRRFRPSLRPIPAIGRRQRLRLRREGSLRESSSVEPASPTSTRPRQITSLHRGFAFSSAPHNFDYSEPAYYGLPGMYRWFVWSASDVARQGPLGSVGKARSELPGEGWSEIGVSEEWPAGRR